MENETKLEKAPVGALLIMLGAGIFFINAIATYAFNLQYVNFKFFGFLALFIQIIQSLAMLCLGVSLINKKKTSLAVAGVALSTVLASLFAVLMRYSTHPILYQMNDYAYWQNRYVVYIIFLIGLVAVTIMATAEKEGANKIKPLIYCGVLLVFSFFVYYTEELQGVEFAYIITNILEISGLLLVALHKISGKFAIASKPITKKAFLRILIVMAIATAIMIPISYDLNDGFGSSSDASVEKECASCDREFKDETNKKYISRTNMCRNCYMNFCAMTGKEPKIY